MATALMRPMSFGEILDSSLGIYRRIFGTLVAIAIVCQGIPSVLGIYLELSGGVLIHPWLWLVTAVLGMVAALFTFGASLWAISEAYLGRRPGIGESIRYAFSKAVKLMIAGLAAYIIIFLGFMLLIVPGIIIGCGYSVVPQAVVLEDIGATESLGRSWRLTRDYRWRAFGLGLVSLIIVYVPMMAIGIIGAAVIGMDPTTLEGGGFSTANLIFSVAAQLVGLVVYPILNCVFTLFYYDLRVRKEGFDLEHLSQQLGMAPHEG